MKRTLLFTLFLCAFVALSDAQHAFTHWYFGSGAGMDFITGEPVFDPSGSTDNIYNGYAAISNDAGELLFYTDGGRIWNRDHVGMVNGSGLYTSQGYQTVLIVPQPAHPDIYYVFTLGADPMWINPYGLYYSIVDMSLDGGNGAVTDKNVLVVEDAKGVTGILHADCTNFWIVTNAAVFGGDDDLQSWLLSEDGLADIPEHSVLPDNIYPNIGFGTTGFLRASQLSDRLVYISSMQETIFLMDYDNTSGTIADIAAHTYSDEAIFSAEFSRSGKRLYMDASFHLYQFNTEEPVNADVLTSPIVIFGDQEGEDCQDFGCMQIGEDDKIYIGKFMQEYAGVINEPEIAGASCDYVHDGFHIIAALSGGSLPNRVNTLAPASIAEPFLTDTIYVTDVSYVLDAGNPGAFYNWSTGEHTQTITVSESGNYTVTIYSACGSSDYSVYVEFVSSTAISTILSGDCSVQIISGRILPSAPFNAFTLRIFDAQGRCVVSVNNDYTAQNIGGLQKGIYFWELNAVSEQSAICHSTGAFIF